MSTAQSGAECRNLWKRCVDAEYLTSIQARGSHRCRLCASPHECNTHFCLLCMEGRLCPLQFRDRNAHDHHPWLQVRSIADRKAINANEVEHFLGVDSARIIQKYALSNRSAIYDLKTKEWTTREGKKIVQPTDVICGGCESSISKAEMPIVRVEARVCSIECLIKFADRKQEPKYLALRDGVNLREPYVSPMKLSENRVNSGVPLPLRLLNAPGPGPQHNAGVDDVKIETDSAGEGAKMEDGNGIVDMEIDAVGAASEDV